VIALSTGLSARAGILVKDRLALERMRTVNAVVFDKTGTLTKGQPAVIDIAATDENERGRHRLLALAGPLKPTPSIPSPA
jgi:Cu2+-exporting ATPase